MIDRDWMQEFAYAVKKCPKCKQQSFCLIFDGEIIGQIWECAESTCAYNPSASKKSFK